MDWQPIITAPRDGTEIILFGEWSGEISGIDHSKSIYIASYEDNDWVIKGGDYYRSFVVNPTHWTFLPRQPK